jgi:hypothetical protein
MSVIFVIFLFILSLTGLCACHSPDPGTTPLNPAPNFAFTFEYGSCNRDIIDTFKETFTKDMIVEPAVTIPFILTNDQKNEIYREMVEINLWDYPEHFSIPIPGGAIVGIVTPAMEYRITVRNGELTKTIYWLDEITEPTTPQAEQLRSFFMRMIEMIQNSPEYKQLPELTAGCL